MTRREIIKTGGLGILSAVLPLSSFIKFNSMEIKENFEVIIVGGSYAGLSAAMSLGRSLRRVLIIDSGLPCNRQTPHSHNFITQDGEKPSIISHTAKTQVLKYNTVTFYSDVAISGEKVGNGFKIQTQSGQEFHAKKVVFATGIKDTIPDIPGFKESWGISIVHCPYCHGYEHRSQKTGIMANGEKAFHLASLVNNLTNNLTIFTSGKPDFSAEQIEKLNKHNIGIIESKISGFDQVNGYINKVHFTDGSGKNYQTVYAALPFTQHSDIPVKIGCKLNEFGYIKVNEFNKTNIEGVYACGDNTNMMRSVANAVQSGNMVGAIINAELTNESF